MKAFANRDARSLEEAVRLAREALDGGQSVSFAGGGTDLLQLVKDQIVNRPGQGVPDLLVSLRDVEDLSGIAPAEDEIRVGGLTTVATLAGDPLIGDEFAALAEAARSVATPQIRNAGTVAGNVMQRPWCWYYRNGFPCYKAGGSQCYSITGENGLHAILGGGPSFIVHPSDLATALTAFGAVFEAHGPAGERALAVEDFFVLPSTDPGRENVLADDEVLAAVRIPRPPAGTRSAFHKVMDRNAWTHAVVSAAVVLVLRNGICESARIVLGGVAPVPWRAEAAEELLEGERVTAELAGEAGAAAVLGAVPLSGNAYKVPLARTVVERTILGLQAPA